MKNIIYTVPLYFYFHINLGESWVPSCISTLHIKNRIVSVTTTTSLFDENEATTGMNQVENSFVTNGQQGIDNTSSSSKSTIPSTVVPSTTTISSIDPSVQQQTILRNILKDKNRGTVATEKKYAIADGSLLDRLNTPMIDNNNNDNNDNTVSSDGIINQSTTINGNTATTTIPKLSPSSESTTTVIEQQQKSKLQQRIERMIKPRAYPLFLLEKGFEVIESIIIDTTQSLKDIGIVISNDETTTSATTTTTSTSTSSVQNKERIVILGTGWGSASFLKDIDHNIYDVTVISPRNYFIFTPMLAGASVGTVSIRTVCEPIREINRYVNYYEATATSIDSKQRTVTCESVICEGNSCSIESFDVPYDRLIVSVGAQPNTYGIPGVKEHCNFLKSVSDAQRIKSAMVNCFERANLPNLSDDERINCLTFAIIGAGPTGIEFAAELRDFVEQDGPKYYPQLLKYVRIKVIEASSTILAPFDKSLQLEAVKQMQRDVTITDPKVRALLPENFELTELLLESSVKEVGDRIITLKDGRVIPYGEAIWAAGNGPIPLTLQIIDNIGNEQKDVQNIGRGRLVVDPWLRVIGSNGRIMALGDCACDVNVGRQLPATAQVAAQQGEYIAKLFNKRYNFTPERDVEDTTILPPPIRVPGVTTTSLSDEVASFAITCRSCAKPFQFLNLGILAYTGGGSALAQVSAAPNVPPVKGSGKLGNAVWRSVYFSKQISWRNRLLVLNDWTNCRIFGRDITRL